MGGNSKCGSSSTVQLTLIKPRNCLFPGTASSSQVTWSLPVSMNLGPCLGVRGHKRCVTWEHRHTLHTMDYILYLHRRVILKARSLDEGLKALLGGCASWWKHTQPKAGEASKPLRWVNPFGLSLSLPCRGCPLSVTCWYRPSPFGSISCLIFTDSCDVYFVT